ncbi:amidohydrolase family protein [Bdellovibrionota bacterium FG-2]
MPHRKNPVNIKHQSAGFVDLHFHGAFGIDLMQAAEKDLNSLARKLAKEGISGFCLSTLSSHPKALRETLTRLGKWTRSIHEKSGLAATLPLAFPLGIHLEGPFLSPSFAGAHPENTIRKATLEELEDLRLASKGMIRMITLAPEEIPPKLLAPLCQWAHAHKIKLFAGHSAATKEQSFHAFDQGFSGVTHAWNAMKFHHRAPGLIGAALGNPNVFLELIADQIHLSKETLHWSLALHPKHLSYFVSDAAPSANSRKCCSFGPIQITNVKDKNGGYSARISAGRHKGNLAGGGELLPQNFVRWLETDTLASPENAAKLLQNYLPQVTRNPLSALSLPLSIKRLCLRHRLQWQIFSNGKLAFFVDSLR